MSERRKEIYVSNDVWKAYWMLAKSKTSEGHIVTVEDVADDVLRQHIKNKYPQLFAHQQQMTKLQREVIATLK